MSKHRRLPKIIVGLSLDIYAVNPVLFSFVPKVKILKDCAPYIYSLYKGRCHVFIDGDDAHTYKDMEFRTVLCHTKRKMHRVIKTIVDELDVIGERYYISGRISVFLPREIRERLRNANRP